MKNKELTVGEEVGVDRENLSQTAPSRTPTANLSGFSENPVLPVFGQGLSHCGLSDINNDMKRLACLFVVCFFASGQNPDDFLTGSMFNGRWWQKYPEARLVYLIGLR